jgi:CBS domain-containing protein
MADSSLVCRRISLFHATKNEAKGEFMSTSTVTDVFSKQFTSVLETDTISKCFSLFKEGDPVILIVYDSMGEYTGVLDQRWINRSMVDPTTTNIKTVMRAAPIVSLDDSLSQVARVMLETEIMMLPVFRGETLLGVVTDADIIQGFVMETWGDTKVETIMSTELFIVEENASIGDVLSLFSDHDISHAPVLRHGKLVGLITLYYIIETFYHPREQQKRGFIIGERPEVLRSPVKGIMASPVTVSPATTLRASVKKMQDSHSSALVIVTNDTPVGMVTNRDFLEPVAQKVLEEQNLHVQFSVKGVEIDEMQQDLLMREFEFFHTTHTGDPIILCSLRLRTHTGDNVYSTSEGFGIEPTFRLALDRLERQILKIKAMAQDQKYAEMYIRKLKFA